MFFLFPNGISESFDAFNQLRIQLVRVTTTTRAAATISTAAATTTRATSFARGSKG